VSALLSVSRAVSAPIEKLLLGYRAAHWHSKRFFLPLGLHRGRLVVLSENLRGLSLGGGAR